MSSSSAGGRSGTRGAGAGRRVAVLHRQGEMFRLVVAEKGIGGAGAGVGSGAVRIVEAKSFAVGDVSSVRAAIEQLGVEKLVRVLPACACVSRGVEVPDAPEADLVAALSLLAEAHLPTGVPAHRRAWGVIPGPATDGHRAALLLGWAGEAEEAIVPEMETWTSELASLASLVEPKKSTLAVYADRDSGSVAVLAWNGTRSSVRAMRESSVSAADWDGSIARLVEDSAVRFGIDAEVLAMGGGAALGGGLGGRATSLWLDESTKARASRSAGAGDGAWLRDYGVAAGAASLALGVTPASARLVEMTASPRIAVRSRVERAVDWMSEPKRAWRIAIVALALILLLPLGTAWARKTMLQGKARAVEAQQAGKSADELDMRLSMYRELDKRRLPMAKVIADIAGCMPPGISLDSLQVIAADKRLAIRGKAPDRSTLTAFVSKLNASGVFGECDFSRADAKDDSVEFDVSGKVTGPMNEARGVEDWTKVPLAVKLYGEEARQPRLSVETKPEKKPAAAKRGSGAGRDVFDARPAAKAATPVPPPLSDEDIKKLTQPAGSKELVSRRLATTRADIDAATKDRLKQELDKLRAHLTSLQEAARGSK